MSSKNNIVIIIVSVVSGLILLALGVLIGRSLQKPRFFVTESAGENGGNQQLLELGNTLEVQGQISLPIELEVATIHMGAEVCDQDARQVNQEINMIMENLVKELSKAGLPGDTVIPSSFSMFDQGDEYCGENQVAISTDDLEQVNHLIDLAINAGTNEFYSIEYTFKDIEAARQEAIELAFKDAERQAQLIADSLDQTLGKVINSKISRYDYLPSYSPDQSGVWLTVPVMVD